MMPMPCFRSYFSEPQRFHDFFTTNVPRMAYYYTTLNDAQRRKFIGDLEAGARPAGATDELPIDSAHVQNFSILPFYVESLFKRFDNDRSGVLTVEEARQAYPEVCPLILQVTRKPYPDCHPQFPANCSPTEEGFVEAIFGYLLKNGAPPPSGAHDFWSNVEQTLNFLGWNVEWWSIKHMSDVFPSLRFYVDRGRIMSIVGSLATQQASAPLPPGATPPPSCP
jgi:hypothetical protein